MSSPLQAGLRGARVSPRRLLVSGLALALIAAVSGTVVELWRFGSTQAAAAARVEQEVRQSFDRMTAVLTRVALGVASDPAAARALSGGPEAARDLFELVDRRLSEAGTVPDTVAVTVYDRTGIALAWVGRPSDVRDEKRLAGPSAFFVAPSPLGLRLVHILPILSADQHRVGSVAAEHVLSPAPDTATIPASGYVLETPLGPASLRTRWEGAGDQPRENAFLLHAPGGEPLVEVSLSPENLRTVRRAWRRDVAAAVLIVAGITVLLLIGPLLDRRASAASSGEFLRATSAAIGLVAAASAIVLAAMTIELGRRPPPSALLLAGGLTIAAAIALLAGPVVRVRIALRSRRRNADRARAVFFTGQVLAGIAVAIVLVVFALLLPRVVDPATVDLRHFSLHPWNPARLALLIGMLGVSRWRSVDLHADPDRRPRALADRRHGRISGADLRALGCTVHHRGDAVEDPGLDAARARPRPVGSGVRRRRAFSGSPRRVVSAYARSRHVSSRCSSSSFCLLSCCIRLSTTSPKGPCAR